MRIRSVVRALTVAAVAFVSAACQREPSVDELQRAVVAHPEIVYAAIRAHPAEFIRVVDSAANQAREQLRADAVQATARQIEDGVLHPRTVPLSHRAAIGNPSATVTIVEYSDFQCPFCRGERDVLISLLEKYPTRVRLVVKHTPLDIHPLARPAAHLFEAIARRDPMAAYRFYDQLFEHQDLLNRDGSRFLAVAARRALGNATAAEAALRDAETDSIEAIVRSDEEEGRRLGFAGTPGFLIDGVPIQGAIPLTMFEEIMRRRSDAAVMLPTAAGRGSCTGSSCPRPKTQ